jgi:hypothetical protein
MPKPADLSVTGLRRRHVLTLLGMVGVSAREREPLRGVGVGGDGRHRGGPFSDRSGGLIIIDAADEGAGGADGRERPLPTRRPAGAMVA